MDEYAHDPRLAAQDMVGAAPDDDTWPLFGYLADNFRLQRKQVVVLREARAFRALDIVMVNAARLEQTSQRGFQLFIREQARVNPAFLRCHSNNLAVIVRDVQLFGQLLADGASAAAVLAGNRDDCSSHAWYPPFPDAVRRAALRCGRALLIPLL